MRRSRPTADPATVRRPLRPPPPHRAPPHGLGEAVDRLRYRHRLIQALFGTPTAPSALDTLIAEAEAFNRDIALRVAWGQDPGVCRPLPPALLDRARALGQPAPAEGAAAPPQRPAPVEAGRTPLPLAPPAIAALLQDFDRHDFWSPINAAHGDWIEHALAGLDTWIQRGADPAETWVLALGDQLQLAFVGLLMSEHQTPAQLRRLLDPLNAFVDRCNRVRRLPLGQIVASLEPPPRALVARAIALAQARCPTAHPTDRPAAPLTAPRPDNATDALPPPPRTTADPTLADDIEGLARALHQDDDRLVLQYRNRVQHRLTLAGREADDATQALIAQATARVARPTGLMPRPSRTGGPARWQ